MPAPTQRTFRRSAALAVLCLALVAGACSNPQGGGSFAPSGGGGGGSGPVRVGVVGNFSGPLSYVGLALEAGIQHAADTLNERDPEGINGRQIDLKKCDSQFSPSTGVNCITKLVSNDRVDVLFIDTPDSLMTLGPKKVAALEIPIYLPTLVPPDLDVKETPNVFPLSNPITENTDLQVLAQYLVQQAGKHRIGIVGGNDEFFSAAGDEFRRQVEGYGGQIVADEKFTFGDVNLSGQVRKVQQANAEVLTCLGLGADCAKVAQAMEQTDYKATFAGTQTLYMRAFRELAKTASNDAVFTLPHSKTNDVAPGFLQWLFDFYTRYGFKTFVINGSTAPDYPGLEFPAFQALDIYSKAAKHALSTEPAEVIEAMRRPDGYKSAGTLRIWPEDSSYPKVDPTTEPWVTRFRDGHISWDLDPRAVPALEEARIAWENRMFTADYKDYKSMSDFILAAATTFLEELEKRSAGVIEKEGQAAYDQRVAQLNQAIELAQQSSQSGEDVDLPELG